MSASCPSNESELPCAHCETPLHAEVQFCFECGAPVLPELLLPRAPAGADEELRTAAFSPVSIRPNEAEALAPGETIEIESIAKDVVVEEVPIDLDELEADSAAARPVADPHGTVVAAAPDRPMPFWPAPPKGETVVAPPPVRAG
ncbi:MAG: hypothetical protein ACE37F_04340 [Nannocystaceae bacterium]|nr:hypothetical protein [bacterium]